MRSMTILLCLVASLAQAQQDLESVDRYLDIWPYFVEPDEERGTADNGAGIRVAPGIHFGGNWFGEVPLFASILETDIEGATDYYLNGIGFDLVYAFGGKRGFSPFLLFGVGAAYNDVIPDEADGTEAYGNVAVGFTTGDLGRRGLRLRAELRYFYDTFEQDFGDTQVGIGVSVPFGRTRERIVEVEREVIREVPVEVIVEREVAPVDLDGDGVADSFDACPNTLATARVDVRGCMLTEQTITLQGVNFEFDSAVLTPHAEYTLGGVVDALLEQPSLVIEIAGHTDSSGSDTYNLNLSHARAESVRNFLTRRGVGLGRMRARGYGEAEPIASNETETGRAENRRVELRILDEE